RLLALGDVDDVVGGAVHDQRGRRWARALQVAVLIVAIVVLVRATTGVRSDRSDLVAATAAEVVRLVSAVAGGGREHARRVDAEAALERLEEAIEERNVAVLIGGVVEIPVAFALRVHEHRLVAGDVLEAERRARALRRAVAAVKDEDDRIRMRRV